MKSDYDGRTFLISFHVTFHAIKFRLRNEVDALIGDKKTITYEDVMNMEYATMLMKVFLSHSWSNTFASVMNVVL